MRLVTVFVRFGQCATCNREPESHGVDGRCLVKVGLPREPESYFDGHAGFAFLDADDRDSVRGGRVVPA